MLTVGIQIMKFPGGVILFLEPVVFFQCAFIAIVVRGKCYFFKGGKNLRAACQLVKRRLCHWTVSICAAAITALSPSEHLNPIDLNAKAMLLIYYLL